MTIEWQLNDGEAKWPVIAYAGSSQISSQIPARGGGETMMEYKGYFAKVEFDDEASIFHGEVINLRDVITFQGQAVDELRQAFRASVDDYLEFCVERGEDPEKPYSGKFVIRVEPELHKTVAILARKGGKSLNAWVHDALISALGQWSETLCIDDCRLMIVDWKTCIHRKAQRAQR